MGGPLVFILAPFLLAFGLFALYLVVSLLLGDPGRPFRMFASHGPSVRRQAEVLLGALESGDLNEEEARRALLRLEDLLGDGGEEGDAQDPLVERYRALRKAAEAGSP